MKPRFFAIIEIEEKDFPNEVLEDAIADVKRGKSVVIVNKDSRVILTAMPGDCPIVSAPLEVFNNMGGGVDDKTVC